MVAAQYAKKLLALHGKVRPQPATEWTGVFAIPVAIAHFYFEVGPANVTIESHGNPYFLPCLADLWKFQAGYRWNGLTGEPISDWDDDWLVVADEGGDPFIFLRSTEAVLHAYHGAGNWNLAEMFVDLNTMAACLAQLGAVVQEAGEAFTEDDCSIRPKYREKAFAELSELLGSAASARMVIERLWS